MTTAPALSAAAGGGPRPYDSRQIANYFIRLKRTHDGQGPSITQLVKLVYLAHGWTLALHDRPLINDQVEAWRHGPVIRTVYHAFRPYGTSDLQPVSIYEDPLEPEIKDLLDRVYEMYKHLTPVQLTKLVHLEGGPWCQSYQGENTYTIIEDSLIAEHYRDS